MGTEQLIREFLAEAEEHFLTLEPNLLRLEKDPSNRELINEIFLTTHSMKGTAAYVGLAHISNFTHALESLLEPLRQGRAHPSPALIDILLHGVDMLKDLVQHVAQGKTPPDTSEIVAQLNAWQQDLAQQTQGAPSQSVTSSGAIPEASAHAPDRQVDLHGLLLEREDCEIFVEISRQQLELMRLTLEHLRAGLQEVPLDTERLRQQLAAIVKAFRKIQSSAAMLKVKQLDAALAEHAREFVTLETADSLLTTEEIHTIARMLQRLEAIIASVSASSPEEPSSPPLPPPEDTVSLSRAVEWSRGRYTLRVEAERVDYLLNLVGELVISRARLVQIGRELKTLYEDLRTGDLIWRQGSALQRKKEARLFKQVKESLDETTVELGRLTNQMQEATMHIRMVPISQVVSHFPRMVRDLARQAGKEVEIVISGADTELDKTMIDMIGDPLIHLIRNAIDHGIETPDERVKRGKARQGTIKLSASYEGNQVMIAVQDDGQGLDLERIKQKAVQQGVIRARDAETLSEREAMALIFASGLSTVESVSSLSGRGVGLNVVKRYLEKLSGAIELESIVGKGCAFLIKLPLTLAIIPALMVRVGAELFAIPLMAVEEAIRFGPHDIHTIEAQQVMRLRDRMIPVFDLADLLGRPVCGSSQSGDEAGTTPMHFSEAEGQTDEQAEKYYGVIVSDGVREIGVRVDALCGEGDIVIKSLRHDLLAVEGISGASIRGDGQVSLVIDTASLITLAITRVKQQHRARSEGDRPFEIGRDEHHTFEVTEDDPRSESEAEGSCSDPCGWSASRSARL
ncbi:cheA signal transduction histidine kinase [Candidatus Vecturithrix granuli]|uniref:Chemotaxis protein CheA n=1 Tax=Vecturithrix granuli TaxID=1499967 RepID=A0A081BU16_VECG1|nr:cheA signal transduction histidine kinase [Candidatus Vecturithrix granuli]